MEILKRAKGDSGELVSFNTNEEDLQEEINRRTAKAGYTTKYGERPYRTKIMTTVAFGRVKYNLWPRDKNGNLIE